MKNEYRKRMVSLSNGFLPKWQLPAEMGGVRAAPGKDE